MKQLFSAFFFPSLAVACSCVSLPFCERLVQAPVVFWGETVEGGLGPGEDAWQGGGGVAKLRVIEAFRGVPEGVDELEVSLFFWKGMCSPMPYRRGSRTLVFLHPRDDGSLHDGMCTSSFFAEEGSIHLEMARRYFLGETTTLAGVVSGRDLLYRRTPIQAAQVNVWSPSSGKRYSVLTSEDGSYGFLGLPKGTYRIGASKDGYRSGGQVRTARIGEAGCDVVDLTVLPKNVVSGIVVDPQGQPVRGVDVALLRPSGEETWWKNSSWSDEKGRFEVNEIDPGKYIVRAQPLREDSPFGSTILADPKSPNEPRIFELGPETRFTDLEIRLPLKSGPDAPAQ